MDNIITYSHTVLSLYFNTLKSRGFVNSCDRDKLIILLHIQELLDESYKEFQDEETLKVINKSLYTIYGSSCLFPYPVLSSSTSLYKNY